MESPEIVPLRESAGSAPLFCFPGAGGAIGIFHEMAASIDATQSVYGIDLQNFFAVDRSFTVEQLADLCLSTIREKRDQGPYLVCGYSFGAIIAYEVASRLKHLGEEVGIVAMIDTGNPAYGSELSPAETQQLNKSYVSNRLRKYFHILTSGNIGTFASGLSAVLAARAGVRTRRAVRKLFSTMNRPMPYIFRHNDRSLFEAWSAYKPPPSELPLLLFYEEKRSLEYGGDQTLGWRLCTSGKIQLEPISAGHVEMMTLPHVRRFAARLSECLKESDNRHGKTTVDLGFLNS
jgi:thioesterase domain-containing protein